MTEPFPPTFEVGKRAYWIHVLPRQRFISPPGSDYVVHSGVVMSTGPAVTQVWDDNSLEPREHNARTFANDKLCADRRVAEKACRKQNQWLAERHKAVQKKIDEYENPRIMNHGK